MAWGACQRGGASERCPLIATSQHTGARECGSKQRYRDGLAPGGSHYKSNKAVNSSHQPGKPTPWRNTGSAGEVQWPTACCRGTGRKLGTCMGGTPRMASFMVCTWPDGAQGLTRAGAWAGAWHSGTKRRSTMCYYAVHILSSCTAPKAEGGQCPQMQRSCCGPAAAGRTWIGACATRLKIIKAGKVQAKLQQPQPQQPRQPPSVGRMSTQEWGISK